VSNIEYKKIYATQFFKLQRGIQLTNKKFYDFYP
jgi:hypothetical protein